MPESPKKQRTISYKRASWVSGTPTMTLQGVLHRCLESLPLILDTKLLLPDVNKSVVIQNRCSKNDRIYLHLAADTLDEHAVTIPHNQNVPNADLATAPPGKSWGFLNGTGMMLVSRNNCLLLPSKLPASSLLSYIQKLIMHARDQAADIPEKIEHFDLIQRANKDPLQKIQQEGVRSLVLNVGMYAETGRSLRDDKRSSTLSQLSRNISKLLITKDKDRASIEKAENTQCQVQISLKGGVGMQPKELASALGETIRSNADEVMIMTGKGNYIRMGEMALKKTVRVPSFGNTLAYKVAWGEMDKYFTKLSETGALEEERGISWSRLALFFVGVGVGVGVFLIYAGPPAEGTLNEAFRILVTALSILAGVLIAVVTVLGNPERLYPGSHRVASAHRREIHRVLDRFALLFYCYIVVIILLFASTLIDEYAPGAPYVGWIKRIAVALGTAALIWSLGLPSTILKAQRENLDAEVEKRLREASQTKSDDAT